MGNIWTMNRTLKQLWQTPRLYIAILDGRVQPTLALAPDITGTNANWKRAWRHFGNGSR